jgi:hypothetical protein
LSPDTWGKNFYKRVILATGTRIGRRGPTVLPIGIRSRPPTRDGKASGKCRLQSPPFSLRQPSVYMAGQRNAGSLYLKKHLFFDGVPRDAAIHFALEGKYWLYVNGTLTSSDTMGKHQPDKRDSIAGISKLFTGGDNEVALHVSQRTHWTGAWPWLFRCSSIRRQHFTSSGKYLAETDVYAEQREKKAFRPTQAPAGRHNGPGATGKNRRKNGVVGYSLRTAKQCSKELTYDHEFRNRGELLKATTDLQMQRPRI